MSTTEDLLASLRETPDGRAPADLLVRQADLARRPAQRRLTRLVAEGALVAIGNGRARRYRIADPRPVETVTRAEDPFPATRTVSRDVHPDIHCTKARGAGSMNLADRSRMTAADFLEWASTLPEGQRHELVGGEPVAMSPGRNRHSLVKLDCAVSLRQAVRSSGAGCTVFGDGATVVVDDTTVYEPDVTVQCGESIDLDSVTVSHPTILVEVLSPSTQGVHTGRKLIGYFQLPSVAHYLVLDPETWVVTHHSRSGSQIITSIVREGRIVLSPPGLELEVADLFSSVA